MRIVDTTRTFTSLKGLEYAERDSEDVQQSIEQPNGMILITGPTGTGKTSTLYII